MLRSYLIVITLTVLFIVPSAQSQVLSLGCPETAAGTPVICQGAQYASNSTNVNDCQKLIESHLCYARYKKCKELENTTIRCSSSKCVPLQNTSVSEKYCRLQDTADVVIVDGQRKIVKKTRLVYKVAAVCTASCQKIAADIREEAMLAAILSGI